jgi:stage II sporulation SpoE-like protein
MSGAEAVRWLQATAPGAGPDELPALVQRVAAAIGATEIAIYLADYAQSHLVPLAAAGPVPADPSPAGPSPADPSPADPVPADHGTLEIDTTLGGRAFAYLRPQHAPEHPDRLWVPLADGCERLGVLEVVTPSADDPRTKADATELAACVAQLLKTRRGYGDVVERLRRRRPMQVAAEIVWGLLPPLTFATDDLVVTAVLEPCYDVGGDVFDYALNGDVLSVGLFDTCGHGIKASALASLAVGAYRNARRRGLTLFETAETVDTWLRREHPHLFATGLIAELDRTTGTLRMINAGHPGAQLLRDGEVVKELPGPTALPFGLGHLAVRPPAVHEEALHPGDRLLAYTDGVTDAIDAHGERFGIDRLLDLVRRALNDELPTPETMRRLVRSVVAHQSGGLQDDATAMFVEWRPPRDPLGHLRPDDPPALA